MSTAADDRRVPRKPDPFLRAIGQRIRQLRDKRGLSQEAFADAAGLDRSYMSGIERGLRNFGILQLLKVAKALEKDPAALLPKDGSET